MEPRFTGLTNAWSAPNWEGFRPGSQRPSWQRRRPASGRRLMVSPMQAGATAGTATPSQSAARQPAGARPH
eukprot:10522186-Lingulodinium_polyedra.AAC.1